MHLFQSNDTRIFEYSFSSAGSSSRITVQNEISLII